MGRLFVLFFLMPWWVYIPASIGVYWLGERVYEQALETEAEKTAALQTAAPDAIDIGAFDRDRDIHTADEVHVIGLIDHDLDYELVERTNGVPTSTRYLYMIFGAEEFGSKVVRGALMLDKREEAAFLETKADEWALDGTPDYWVYAFNGFATRTTTLDDMADSAIAEQGLTKAEDFVFIEPFFDGREAALAARGVPEQTRYIGWAIAGVVALIGVFKRVMSVRSRPAPGAEGVALKSQEDLAAYTPPPPQPEASTFKVPEGVSDDTPLGRLARRNAPAAPAPVEEPLSYTAYGSSEADGAYDETIVDEDMFDLPQNHDVSFDEGVRFQDPGVDLAAAGHGAASEPAHTQSSATSFYAKLALAMVLVGTLTYDPSLVTAAVPLIVTVLIVFTVVALVRKARNRAVQAVRGAVGTPRHTRRPDAGAQPLAAGGIDLGGPVQSSRQERGVI